MPDHATEARRVVGATERTLAMASSITEQRLDRLEEALAELAARHVAMLGRVGARTPVLDELVTEVAERREESAHG